MSVICARLGSKGKVGVQRGRETAGVPSFLPSAVGTASSPPRARRIPALRRAQLPAEVQRKTPRPDRANTLTQFVCPAQPAQKRSRPSGANPPAAVRVPWPASAAKGAARIGRTRLRQFACTGHLVPRKEKHRRIASTVLKVGTFTQIAAEYRHPYAPAPAGPVPDDRAR